MEGVIITIGLLKKAGELILDTYMECGLHVVSMCVCALCNRRRIEGERERERERGREEKETVGGREGGRGGEREGVVCSLCVCA